MSSNVLLKEQTKDFQSPKYKRDLSKGVDVPFIVLRHLISESKRSIGYGWKERQNDQVIESLHQLTDEAFH